MNVLRIPEKDIRAKVIKRYMKDAGYSGAVCFTCGNAARALRKAGVYVLEIGPSKDADLSTDWWWSPEFIHKTWPHLFDATSGHLPAPIMARIARELHRYLGALPKHSRWKVPTGSGETIICLRWAYPLCIFEPMYNCGKGTTLDILAPLSVALKPIQPTSRKHAKNS